LGFLGNISERVLRRAKWHIFQVLLARAGDIGIPDFSARLGIYI